MRYDLRWADLGPRVHVALGVAPDRRVLVVNVHNVPGDPGISALVRQAVDVAAGTPYGTALMADKDRTIRLLTSLGEMCDTDPDVPDVRVLAHA